MHELSLCRSIADIVERARGARSVDVVHLRIGQLRQVVPPTLTYCWELVTTDTDLAGSRLQIEHIPVRLTCLDCAASTEVSDALLIACGECGSPRVRVDAGEEFLLTSIALTRQAPADPAHVAAAPPPAQPPAHPTRPGPRST